jgi:purine-cytosine permease-like protein
MVATTANPDWATAYTDGSVGGLIGAVLAPAGGFGKFCLVLLAFSIVANNIPNNYSVFFSTMAKLTCSLDCLLRSLEIGLLRSLDSFGLSQV